MQTTLSDGRVIAYGYDANGNLTSVTPPGRPEHVFGFSPIDQVASYDPPEAGISPDMTSYTYTPDRNVDIVTRSDGATYDYDEAATGLVRFDARAPEVGR
mgnify:CR=1 FL=1